MTNTEPADVALDDPDTREIDTYAQGACHVFAIACHLRHGGDFVIAFDTSEDHWVDENGDTMMHPVLHVFARIEGPDGIILRDIFGDRPDDQDAVRSEVSERFSVWEQDILLEDADASWLLRHIADVGGNAAADLAAEDEGDLDPEDRPLSGYGPDFLAETREMGRVIAVPGSLPLMPVADLSGDPSPE